MKLPAFAVNVPVEAPDAIVIVPGTVTSALSLLSATVVALVAAALSVAVQVADAPGAKAAGAQVTADNCAGSAVGGVNLTIAFAAPPFQEAVTWTSVFAVTAVAATAANVADEAPDAIAIVAGTFNCALEDARAIVMPVAGAGCDKPALQVALPGATTEDGLQVSDCSVIGTDIGVTLIVPPVAVLGID